MEALCQMRLRKTRKGVCFSGVDAERADREKAGCQNPEKWGKGIQIAMIRLNSAIIRGKGVS